MNFTAEEIARFDDVLSDMFESELTFAILAELGLLAVTLTFPDGNGNTVSVKGDEHDLGYPEVGKHRGRVVYAQNSGYVIEVEYDTAQ